MKSISLFVIVLVLAATEIHAADGPIKRPNILFIVADDMGYADCSVQGCKDVATPNIDSIANKGIRFTDGYVTGTVCSPTRAGLMTARYHHRDGIHTWLAPGAAGLNTDVPTIAGYLKNSGYTTALIGKWHLGDQEKCHPLNRGFDEFFGFVGGGHQYIIQANGKGEYNAPILRNREPSNETRYLTDAFGQEAAAYLNKHKPSDKPFFLYLAFNAVHTPLQAIEKYSLRFPDITEKKRKTYAAMLSAMDDNVGLVLNALRETGQEDNTLICFLSDNGGPITRNAPNASLNTPLRGGKGETWEGGIRVPFFMKWNGHLKAGTTFKEPVIQMDITATVLALAGIEADAKWPIDGVNLMPFINGEKTQPHPMLCWGFEQQWAIREGQWKLVFAMPDAKSKTPILGLYNLSEDIAETKDLSATHPERVKQMQGNWEKWRNEVGIQKTVPKANNTTPDAS